jgi:hypothetical protein
MTAHSMRLLSLITIVVVVPSLAVPAQVAGKKNVPTGEGPQPAATSVEAGSLAHLAERLQALCSDKSLSYQKLLRDASHLVRDAALDRPWSEVEAALGRQGLRQMSKWSKQYTKHYEYLVNKTAWIAGDGTAHSLYLQFMVRRPDEVPTAKPGCVMVAAAGLLAEPNRPYEKVLASGAYPRGSVVFVGLRLPEVVETARNYPIVKKIEVTYDLIWDRWAESVQQGFDLRITFGRSALNDREGNAPSFTVPSGLDATQDRSGRPLDKQFKPEDTIGEFRYWGGIKWKRTD